MESIRYGSTDVHKQYILTSLRSSHPIRDNKSSDLYVYNHKALYWR